MPNIMDRPTSDDGKPDYELRYLTRNRWDWRTNFIGFDNYDDYLKKARVRLQCEAAKVKERIYA